MKLFTESSLRGAVIAAVLLMFACSMQSVSASLLSDYQVNMDDRVEAEYDLPEGFVITGLGVGQQFANEFTTFRVKMQPLLENGELGLATIVRAGTVPEHDLFTNIDLPHGWVAVGFGAARWTLAVWAAPLRADGSLGEPKEFRVGNEPDADLDIQYVAEPNRVLTGVGLRFTDAAMAGIRAVTARTPGTSAPAPAVTNQPDGLHVGNMRVEIDERIESRFFAPEGFFGDHQGIVVTGLGARASGHEICGVLLRYQSLRRDGSMGAQTIVRAGVLAERDMEAEIMLPDGYVVVGVGVSGMAEGDIKTMIVYGSRLMPDGKLGFVREFRGGFFPERNDIERSVMLEGNRILTGYGLRMMGHAIVGIRVESMEITGVPTSN